MLGLTDTAIESQKFVALRMWNIFYEWRDKAFKEGRKIPFWNYQFQISENDRFITILDAECIVSYMFDYFGAEDCELCLNIEENYIGKAKWFVSADGELFLNLIVEKEQNLYSPLLLVCADVHILLHATKEHRMCGNAHVRCGAEENSKIISKDYL